MSILKSKRKIKSKRKSKSKSKLKFKLKFQLRYFASQKKIIDHLWTSNNTIEI